MYCYTFTFDLHVLGAPPAFVLSQDQTLMFYSFVSQLFLKIANQLFFKNTRIYILAKLFRAFSSQLLLKRIVTRPLHFLFSFQRANCVSCCNHLLSLRQHLFLVFLLKNGGGERDRTDDPQLAKLVLSQLSYTPTLIQTQNLKKRGSTCTRELKNASTKNT